MLIVDPSKSSSSGTIRVAVVTTAIVMVLVLIAAIGLNQILNRRLRFNLDQDLQGAIASTLSSGYSLTYPGALHTESNDGQVIDLWWQEPGKRTVALTSANPSLPRGAWRAKSAPLSLHIGSQTYRFLAVAYHGGWILAAENQYSVHHLEIDVVLGELLLAPVALGAVFVGVIIIGRRAAAPIEEAHRRQLAFTADASHELRTPIAVIDAELQLARQQPDDTATTLVAIERETKRLKTMVANLLFLARADATPTPPQKTVLDLSQVVGESAQRFHALAAAKTVDFHVTLSPSPLPLEAPREWIDQLIGVVVDNACRYCESGGVVRVVTYAEGNEVGFFVADSGPGVTPKAWPTLISRFHRESDRPGGAGLGLAIGDVIVRGTGGRWRVERAKEGGAQIGVSWHRHSVPRFFANKELA